MDINFTDINNQKRTGNALFKGYVSTDMPEVYEVQINNHTTIFVSTETMSQVKYVNNNF